MLGRIRNVKHCPTCKCDQLPDAKTAPGAAKVKCFYCPKDAICIVYRTPRCLEHSYKEKPDGNAASPK